MGDVGEKGGRGTSLVLWSRVGLEMCLRDGRVVIHPVNVIIGDLHTTGVCITRLMRPVPVPCLCTVSDDVFPVGFDTLKGFRHSSEKVCSKNNATESCFACFSCPKKGFANLPSEGLC